MALAPFTVSQVNDFISKMFKTEPLLRPVVVKGEVSYLNYHSNGNIYLSISDSKSKLDCVVFSNRVDDVARNLSPGDEIICAGNIESFPAQSKYSLWVNGIELAGEGELALQFEKLKKKLHKEGLFDKEHKKPLPAFPKHIGVVTSATGAAVQDILKILKSRTPLTDITVFPVLVQGPNAPYDMVKMLNLIDKEFNDDIDLLILGRGGGSTEDLSVFNDEGLARAIYNCSIPIISAVGHEIDTTIADFVADQRAETPTAAAQMAVKSVDELKDIIDYRISELNRELANRIMHKDFQAKASYEIIKNRIKEKIKAGENLTENAMLILRENDPRIILNRGYAIVSNDEGKRIMTSKGIIPDENYTISFQDGDAKVRGV